MITEARLTHVKRMKTLVKMIFSIPKHEMEKEFEALEGFPGYLKFAGKPITKEIEDAMENKHLSADIHGKTKSQVLRGLLFELWTLEDPEQVLDASEFYDTKMDQLIDYTKKKINEARTKQIPLPPE